MTGGEVHPVPTYRYPDLGAPSSGKSHPAELGARRIFYDGVRQHLTNRCGFAGLLPNRLEELGDWQPRAHEGDPDWRAYFVAVCGLLSLDVREVAADPARQRDLVTTPHFVKAVQRAAKEYRAHAATFDRVFAELARLGASDEGQVVVQTVLAAELAKTSRLLVQWKVGADDPQWTERFGDALARARSGKPKDSDTGGSKTMACDRYPGIDVPEFDERELTKEQVESRKFARRRFYHAVRHLLTKQFRFHGDLPPTLDGLGSWDPGPSNGQDPKPYFFSVSGLLLADGVSVDGDVPATDDLVVESGDDDIRPPKQVEVAETRLVKLSGDGGNFLFDVKPTHPDDDEPMRSFHVTARFVRAVTAAVQEYQANRGLFDRVFTALGPLGTKTNGSTVRALFPRQLAEVARRLAEQKVLAGDPQLDKRIDDALSLALGNRIDGRTSSIVLDLPDLDLDAGTAADIVKDNVVAVAVIYYSAMLEDWKYFAVADKVAEQFTNGTLPITKGRGGDMVYEYIRGAPQRMTEFERRGLYARALGLAQGSVEEQMPNREFADLWIRFLSATSLYERQPDIGETRKVGAQQLFKSARDLGVNLSLHGYGIGYFAGAELQKLVRDVHKMFGSPDILAAYGVRDGNQLVDRVSALYLNGSVNGVRQRTMAHAGARIIGWIADNAQALSSSTTEAEELFRKKTASTTALIAYAERWLAVTGTPDPTVEQYSEPVALQTQPTIPSMGLDALGGFRNVLQRAGIGNGQPGAALPAAPALPQM